MSPWPSSPPPLYPQHQTLLVGPATSAQAWDEPSTADATPVNGVVPSVVIAWAYPVTRPVPLLTSHVRSPQHHNLPSLVTAQAFLYTLLTLPGATATTF